MIMKKTLSQRVRQIIDEQNATQVEIAAAAGCTRGLVNQWCNDLNPAKEMAGRYAFKLARCYGYEPEWLVTGEGPERSIAAMNHRVNDLVQNYARCDERGKETVLIVAEREASYNKEA